MPELTLNVKWKGGEYPIKIDDSASFQGFKEAICEATGVQPHRQKVMGLKVAGKTPNDDVVLSTITIKPGQKIMMMGTREENIVETIPEDVASTVVNDLEDIEEGEMLEVGKHPANIAKIEHRVANWKPEILNEFRPDKKLLVLDVDYTLFDHRSPAEQPADLMRPFLHQFLTSAYENYDIVIWSATSMKWVELKMKELGVLDNPNYKISFLMDIKPMISIHSEKYGVVSCKPLQVIWSFFEGVHHPGDTIMFDDIRRNFVCNPQNGLRIKAFRNAVQAKATDTELQDLEEYLRIIATMPDLSHLDHRKWRRMLED